MVAIIAYFFTIDWRIAVLITLMTGIIASLMWVSAYVCIPGMIATDYEHDAIHERLGDVLDNLVNVFLADAGDEEITHIEKMQQNPQGSD